MAPFDVRTIDAAELSRDDIALWRAMLAGNPDLASPYFRPEFAQIVSPVTPGARIAVLSRDGATIGFFPHQRRGRSVQPLAAPMNDYHGAIALPGCAPEPADLCAALGAGRLSFSSWIGPASGATEHACVMSVAPNGFDAWYAERREAFGKFFKDKERARRSLERDYGPLRVETGLRDPALLDQLIELKRQQYRRSERHDIFACGWTRDVLHALVADHREGLGASMAALWAGDTLTALELSLHAGDQYHFWFPVYDPETARCSPGILLTLDTIRIETERGFRVFDFGFEGEPYKKYFINARRSVSEGVVDRSHVGAIGRAALGALKREALGVSIRRRWSTIEACETRPMGKVRGVLAAASAALGKGARSA